MSADEFEKVYYALHPKMWRVAYSLLNDVADAEDILQDAFCKLWDMRAELADIKKPEAFSIRLIKNLCLDFIRAPRNRIDTESTESLLMADDMTPEDELESKQRILQIEAMIDRLPEKQRIVLQMRGCGDYSFEEIEVATGETAANVRVLLSRARKTLKSMLISHDGMG
ncbi:MAG: sigma-70 family RNA polymerase sigma factor [Tannerella sp.]|jgi:RNA polymerase sigma-70 factor (ECF subfamily)|nr:sigma-70 family RNA polymerase sigma factor [Tannerella sp.]